MMSRRDLGQGAGPVLPHTRDGRPILSRDGLTRYDPSPQRSGGRERYRCPVHGGDHQRSFSVDPTTGQYHCHACLASGRLREFWPAPVRAGPARAAPPAPPSLEEQGRRILQAARQADDERTARCATSPLPKQAAAFLGTLDTMTAALQSPGCPGADYLRGRGLDPHLIAALGGGYADPGVWPGDHKRRVGRIVFPLYEPTTGRVVSAMGRLCVTPGATWSHAQQEEFAALKQRKLPGCPAGVWPMASITAARAAGHPLVLVEGPSDAAAVMQRSILGLDVVALCGTARVLPLALLSRLPGVVLALDADKSGADAALRLYDELTLAGVRALLLPPSWLGAVGAKDPADLAALSYHEERRAFESAEPVDLTRDRATATGCYSWAILEVAAAWGRVLTPHTQCRLLGDATQTGFR